jgi:DNA-binding transcriptional MerR regulator
MDISIGQMARLTGLPVKTVRYYSEIGLAPEADRTEAGYRRYDEAALARLELVRTLRELGLDLGTIRRVLQRQAGLAEVAAAHAEAIDVHVRQLRLRRTLLRAIARRGVRPEEVPRMTAFARASADEAGRIMEEFISSVFAEHPDHPFAERMRAALPELPEEPSDEQIDAWVELANLVGDPAFRARVREMVDEGARVRERGNIDEATQRAGRAVVERGTAALAAGISPEAPEAAAIVDDLVAGFATAAGRTDDPAYRAELLWSLETFSDARVERYWRLIGIINGWPETPSLMPSYQWLIAALRAGL